MSQIDKNKLIKLIVTLLFIFLFVGIATLIHKKNSVTLDQYAKQHPELNHTEETSAGGESEPSSVSESKPASKPTTEPESTSKPATEAESETGAMPETEASLESEPTPEPVPEPNSEPAPTPDPAPTPEPYVAAITGGYLNGGADGTKMLAKRVVCTPDSDAPEAATAFYYEPLSETLESYITGVSFPAPGSDNDVDRAIDYADLRYLHILHYDFNGKVAEGELICNKAIADDLLEIFYELYRNEYQLERVLLIDEYAGDDTASMEDNNTSCFNYRVVDGTTNLSKHALGLALDINPFYNPYVTNEADGSLYISPAEGAEYADRSWAFPHKIDKNDLCYKLFIDHGFTWGGNWKTMKDYQHFQKNL